jgi:hypothetical protein
MEDSVASLKEHVEQLEKRIALLESRITCMVPSHTFVEDYRVPLESTFGESNIQFYDYYYKCRDCDAKLKGLSGT